MTNHAANGSIIDKPPSDDCVIYQPPLSRYINAG